MTEFDKYWKIRYLCTYPNNNDYIDNNTHIDALLSTQHSAYIIYIHFLL